MSRANTDLQQIANFVVMIPLTVANLVTVLAVDRHHAAASTWCWPCSRWARCRC